MKQGEFALKVAVHINNDKLFDDKWIYYLSQYGVEAVKVNLFDSDIINKVRFYDGVMWHYHHSPVDKQAAAKILAAIENNLNIPVWPNYNTRWHFDEKISQHYFFSAANAKRVKSWVFWDIESASRFLENYNNYPLIVKLSVGAGSANVFKVDSVKEAVCFAENMFKYGIYPYTGNKPCNKNFKHRLKQAFLFMAKGIYPMPVYYQVQKGYFYVQEFIPNNEKDIRITVIGDRAFAFCRYNREGDFRASGSGAIDYDIKNIPMDAIKQAFELSEFGNFQSMAYDFLVDRCNNVLVNEASYGYVDKAVYECPGYWDRNLNWIEGHMWPEEAHIVDFINYIISRRIE